MSKKNQTPFSRAAPVWARGREREMNLTLAFQAQLAPARLTEIRLTCAFSYQALLNGKLIACGPARAVHGFFRVDRLPVDIQGGEKHVLTIVVAGYNVNTYEYADAPAFLTAEVEQDGEVTVFTGPDGGFRCRQVYEKVQRVDRYSFQRAFAEAYMLTGRNAEGLAIPTEDFSELEQAVYPQRQYLERNVPYPDYAVIQPAGIVKRGEIRYEETNTPDDKQMLTHGAETFTAYPDRELEVEMVHDLNCLRSRSMPFMQFSDVAADIRSGQFAIYKMPHISVGFIGITVSCEEAALVYLLFDEVLMKGDVNPLRMGTVSAIRLELEPGNYHFHSFEPYTLGYLKVAVLKGKCRFSQVHVKEFAYPQSFPLQSFVNSDIRRIYEAAVRTFRHNSVDIFMDCPSRERAGWLCDSFFTARVEKCLTGKSLVEHNFLENFALAEEFAHIPAGMFPMCYPSDHDDGNHIPNWALWLVLELAEYEQRTGDRRLVDQLKGKIDALFAYLEQFENADGLLEDVPGWIFLEWSRANDADVVCGVNYPTNMTYAASLRSAAGLFGDKELEDKALRIENTIRQQAFDGTFFHDNAVRKDGVLCLTDTITEVCQYYAFFFETAAPASHPVLWNILINDFGPGRKQNNRYPAVAFANMFIGNYLRLDVLLRYQLFDQAEEEIKGYFLGMAKSTGTLWELDWETASCDHGFASHVICWLDQIAQHAKEENGIQPVEYSASQLVNK